MGIFCQHGGRVEIRIHGDGEQNDAGLKVFLQGGEVRGEAWADVGKWTTGVNEIDHDRLAFEIREAHGVALLIGELKIRHGLADCELLGRRRNGLVGKTGFAHVAGPGMVFANPQIEGDAQAGMQAL